MEVYHPSSIRPHRAVFKYALGQFYLHFEWHTVVSQRLSNCSSTGLENLSVKKVFSISQKEKRPLKSQERDGWTKMKPI